MKNQIFTAPTPSKREVAQIRLLEAALEVFSRKGVEGATVREIARAAGQNVAAITYYFGGKDQLYQAVLEGIVREIWHRLADVVAEIQALKELGQPAPAAAGELLQKFLREVYLRLLSRSEALPLARLILREQMQPTPAFQILYQQGFSRLHEALCFLVAQVLGRSPREPETIIRTHALMGQIYFFAMTREAILRRLGWKSLGGPNADLVAEIVKDHTTLVLAGLSSRAERKAESALTI